MDIPFDIKIFSLIYESGKYLLPLLFVLWLTWLICVTILRKKKAVFMHIGSVSSFLYAWCRFYLVRMALPYGTA